MEGFGAWSGYRVTTRTITAVNDSQASVRASLACTLVQGFKAP